MRRRYDDHPLRERVERLPRAPGVYLMKNQAGDVLYVGKAVDLRARVRSYFNGSETRRRMHRLMRELTQLDVSLAANEREALLLEARLIRQLQPPFNIALKHAPRSNAIRLDLSQPFPRVDRGPIGDERLRTFGPLPSSWHAEQILDLLERLFPLRTCDDHVLSRQTRPCLRHQLRRCPAPCVGFITAPDYRQTVIDPLLETLQGGWERLETRLRAEMSAAAEALEFEAAAVLRDRLKALEGLRTKKAAPPVSGPERDVIGFVRLADEVAIALLPVRWGRQQPSRTFAFEGQVDGDQSLLTAFLLQLYLEGLDVPPVLQLPFPLEDALLIEQILQEQLGRTITLTWEPDAAGLDAVALLAARTELEGLRDEASRHQRGLDALTRHLRQTAPVTTLTWLGIDAPQQLLWGVRLAADAVTTQVVRVSLRRQPQQQPLPALKGLLERLGPEPGEFLLVEGGRLMLRTLQEAALPQPLLLAALDPPGQPPKRRSSTDPQQSAETLETARTDDPLAIPRLFLPGRRNALLIPRSSPARRTLEHLRQLGWKKAGLSLPCPSTSNPTPPQPTLQNAVAADVLPGQDGEHSGDEDNPWQS